MKQDKTKELLTGADVTAGPPSYGPVSAARIRRRIGRRRTRFIAFPAAAAALILLGVGTLLLLRPTPPGPAAPDTERIASLEEQVRQLQAQSAETLRLVREVVAAERQRDRLYALETELAGIHDPMEQMEQHADATAYTLVYQADRFYRELNQPQSAIETYEQVIRVFPDSPWADKARGRLTQIRTNRTNRT